MIQKDLTNFHEYMPPAKMRIFVDCLLSLEVKLNKDEAMRRTGISKQAFYYHLKYAKDRVQFTEWFNKQRSTFIVANGDRLARALVEKACSGDVAALRLCFELMGDIKAGGINFNNLALPGSRQPLVIVMPGEQAQAQLPDKSGSEETK